MPNRILKESICYSDSIRGLSWFEEVFFYRLIVNADDFGRFDGRVEMLQSRLFPLRRDITDKSIEKALNALLTVGLVQTYECDGRPFLQLVTWESHQQVRATKSKYPAPNPSKTATLGTQPLQMDALDSEVPHPISVDFNCNQMIADVPVIQSESYSESKAVGGESTTQSRAFLKPTIEEVRAYCSDRKNAIDPDRFINHYDSNGWMVGKNKMKDWKAAIRTWEKNEYQKGSVTPTDASYDSDKFDEDSLYNVPIISRRGVSP